MISKSRRIATHTTTIVLHDSGISVIINPEGGQFHYRCSKRLRDALCSGVVTAITNAEIYKHKTVAEVLIEMEFIDAGSYSGSIPGSEPEDEGSNPSPVVMVNCTGTTIRDCE